MINRWWKFLSLIICIFFLAVACNETKLPNNNAIANSQNQPKQIISPSASPNLETDSNEQTAITPADARLVDIQSINKNVLLDIRYATPNNFLKKKLYPEARCVLRYGAAKQLSLVQQDLAKNKLSLKVYDCYRPLSVQKEMWKILPDERYVGNPAKGSRHNRGAAVDLTLIDSNGKELEMPSAFDAFTQASHRDYSGGSVQSRKNRQTLEDAMQKRGFTGLATEWWHFDAPDWDKYAVMDAPFNKIPRK
ncbi:M15 family metallopeptidase [Tolypothrix sp. PCC 7910]|uniref:M15 family metallopeptidase n=1 Tax=Tolypothrix sp. PCC 7910 TaxID=2099387 RepID=UPI00142788B9|nr:M15 family metallopeptidase [Tolypothrix sp. PCC 7910]QIR36680.1 M15 family metallopeptidase [Tolypothrix sp. PCC 7910]